LFWGDCDQNVSSARRARYSNIKHTSKYVHASTDRLQEAECKRYKIDYNRELERGFEAVKTCEIDLFRLIEKLKEIIGF
jgi:hypothetical protein